MAKKKFKVVDLFCGCGGMTLGLEKAGYKVVAGFDNWKPAIDVYEANFNHPVIKLDLSDINNSIREISKFTPDIIVGGPPCQDFSTAGHQDESRGRAILSVCYSEIVCSIKPRYFVMENVAAIHNTKSFKSAIANFKNAGYGLTMKTLDAAYCGVPQIRKRMFVIGELNAKDDFLNEELEKNLSNKPMTIFDYLGNSLGIEHYFRVPTNYNRRAVYSIYEPSMTIRGVDRPIPSGYKGHHLDSAPVNTTRNLTPKERSYIQTFPKEFNFFGGKSDMNTMIGNAVPVNLAKYVAEALLKHIENTNNETK